MNISFQTILEHGLDASATLCAQGFSDYFVPVQISVTGLLTMVRQDSVDLNLSRVVLNKEQPFGVAFVARRGWTSRLAAMSIIPEGRGRGIGEECVRQLLLEANARGDKAMTLEVIVQNLPGVRLYEKCGFQKVRRLVGFNGQIHPSQSDVNLEQVDVRDVARALIAHGPNDLPWQTSGETLAQTGPPHIAYRRESAYVVLSDPTAEKINLRAIVTLSHARRHGNATAILQAVSARHPDKTFRVPPIFPEEIGGLFGKVGMERDTLSQWLMTVEL